MTKVMQAIKLGFMETRVHELNKQIAICETIINNPAKYGNKFVKSKKNALKDYIKERQELVDKITEGTILGIEV